MWKNSPIKADGRELHKAVITAPNSEAAPSSPSITAERRQKGGSQATLATILPAEDIEGTTSDAKGKEESVDFVTDTTAEGPDSTCASTQQAFSPGTIQTKAFKRILGDAVTTLFDESSFDEAVKGSSQDDRVAEVSDGDTSIDDFTPNINPVSLQPPSPQLSSKFMSSNKENYLEKESRRVESMTAPHVKSSSTSTSSCPQSPTCNRKATASAKRPAPLSIASSSDDVDLSQFYNFLEDIEKQIRALGGASGDTSPPDTDDLSAVMSSVLQTPTKKLWRAVMEQHKAFEQQKIFE